MQYEKHRNAEKRLGIIPGLFFIREPADFIDKKHPMSV